MKNVINLSNGREYFGEEFIEEFEKILQECKAYDEFLFIHGTETKQEAEEICKIGLISDYPELYYTAELISSQDKLLYDKLQSWPHWNRKFLMMCCVPKNSGKGGVPIWKQINKDRVVLSPEYIKGYINVMQKQIIINDKYKLEHSYENGIEDRSYLPLIGKPLNISIPPDEIEMYSETLGKDK